MEYVCGDLLGFIRKRGKLSESVSKLIFKEMIEGLKYIHKKKVVHRDIKLDNILIDLTNTIKICDFGVSRYYSKDELMFEHCGTPAYISPEIFENNGYKGTGCDIWSAGVTLYYMLGGVQPFKANSIKELEKNIKKGDFKPLEEVSSEANNLIKGMLQVNPKKRLTVDEILNHPWLSKVDLNQRQKLNLFTEAEKILMSKFDVNYLNSDKSELIENFTLKNIENENNKNLNTINKLKNNIDLLNNKTTNFLKDKDQLLIKIKTLTEENGKLNQKNKKFNMEYNDLKNKMINTNTNTNIYNNGYNTDNNSNNIKHNSHYDFMNNTINNNNTIKKENIHKDHNNIINIDKERKNIFLKDNKSQNNICGDNNILKHSRNLSNKRNNTFINYSNLHNNEHKSNYKLIKNDMFNNSTFTPKHMEARKNNSFRNNREEEKINKDSVKYISALNNQIFNLESQIEQLQRKVSELNTQNVH
jgi:serine/threonine protein kinase